MPLLVLEDEKSKPLGQSLAIMEFLEVSGMLKRVFMDGSRTPHHHTACQKPT